MNPEIFSESQIMSVLREHEAGSAVADLAKCLGVGEATILAWKSKYRTGQCSQSERTRELEVENALLKRLLAEAELDKAALKKIIKGSW